MSSKPQDRPAAAGLHEATARRQSDDAESRRHRAPSVAPGRTVGAPGDLSQCNKQQVGGPRQLSRQAQVLLMSPPDGGWSPVAGDPSTVLCTGPRHCTVRPHQRGGQRRRSGDGVDTARRAVAAGGSPAHAAILPCQRRVATPPWPSSGCEQLARPAGKRRALRLHAPWVQRGED